jgi:hypothetical protein
MPRFNNGIFSKNVLWENSKLPALDNDERNYVLFSETGTLCFSSQQHKGTGVRCL